MTETQNGTPEDEVKQAQIDQLRHRVDAVLANLVQQTDVDQSLQASNTNGKWIVDPYGDRGQFDGELDSNNFPHGTGTMQYSDGRIYMGQWDHGRWHGRGKAVFSNRDTYEGEYHEDQRHGQGTYQWSDGRIYVGCFHMDQRQGKGTYAWPDGANYEGDFFKGLRHGQGRYTFRDGSVFKGEWLRGKYHGKGECRWADGRIYRGEWVAGKAHGQGVEIRPDGSIRHDGKWEHDKPIRNPSGGSHQQPPDKVIPTANSNTTTPSTADLLDGPQAV